MRAFFSVPLPDDLAEPIANLQSAFDDTEGVTPVDPARAHITLKFLGDVNEGTIDDVIAAGERALDRADVDPFRCVVSGLGVFPSLEYISVVWAGIGVGDGDLTRIHESLEAETTAIGFDPADHAFTPHVTLARLNDPRGTELVQAVVRERDPDLGAFDVGEIRLTESTLTPNGPVYEPVETFPLG